jgi:hypothetical protein
MNNQDRTFYSHEAEVRSGRKNIALLVLALGVGAAAALLFAANTGQKTREDLAHGLEQGISKGHDILDPTLKRLEKELAELRKTVEDKVGEQRQA